MQSHSEKRRMNNLSCHKPTGNVLGIYILSSRALDEPSQQSNTWHALSARPLRAITSDGRHRENVSVAWIYIYTPSKQKKGLMNMLDDDWAWQDLDSTVVTRSRHDMTATHGATRDTHGVGVGGVGGGLGLGLAQWAPVFTADNLVSFQQLWGKLNLRKCSFSRPLDQTITRIPTGLQKKHLSSKQSPENECQPTPRRSQHIVDQTEAMARLFVFHLL